MRIAYADPPYIGHARHYYKDDPNCAEVDHNELLGQLRGYDGWGLSCSVTSLREILMLDNCPVDVRICAWVKPWVVYRKGINPVYSWECLLVYGGRKLGDYPKVKDYVSENAPMASGLIGSKPEKFAFWFFDLLGMQSGDELIDLFPGTGIMGKSWKKWERYNGTDQGR